MQPNHPDDRLQHEYPRRAARRAPVPKGSSPDEERLQRERPRAAADLTGDRPQSLPFSRPAIRAGAQVRKARRWWALLALLALVAFGSLLLACGLTGQWGRLFGPAPDVKGDEAAIRRKVAEALPLGSTKEQVETWLKGQGLPYGNLVDVAHDKFVGFGVRTPYTKQYVSGEVRMEFHFDDDGKLVKEDVDIFIPSL